MYTNVIIFGAIRGINSRTRRRSRKMEIGPETIVQDVTLYDYNLRFRNVYGCELRLPRVREMVIEAGSGTDI